MAHAMTKEELDLQFEQFMKESVSDDSVDLGSSSKPSVLDSLGKAPIRTLKKTPVSAPWWHDDDDEDDDDDNSDRGTEKAPKRRFTKVKIPQALDPEVESKWNESPSSVHSKPVPKPRSKAVNRSSPRESVSTSGQKSPELDRNEKSPSSGHISVTKEYPFVSQSTTEFSYTPSEPKSPVLSDPHQFVESSSIVSVQKRNGLESPGKSFRKSLRSTTSIKEVDEEDFKQMLEDEKGNEVLGNLDNLKWHESDLELSTGTLGLSTMEKEETDFLSYLKKESSALSDSSKLIQEQKTSTPASSQRKKEMDSLNEDQQKSDLQVASTPTYSDDFEEEASVKSNHVEIQKKKPEGRVMQAKDCEPPLVRIRLAPADENLADGEETSQQEPAVHSSGQSGRSDMEALQEAYRQISDLVGDCEEGLAAGGRPPISPSTLQPVSTAESDLATCEELMRPIGPEATWKQGIALPPVIEALPQACENPLRIFSEERPFSSANNGSEEDKTARLMEEDHTASVLHNQKNVASEIKRLMQEQESSSVKPPSVKPKTRQVPARSSVFTSVSSRKAPAPLVMHKKPEIASSPTAPAPGRTNRAAKAPSSQKTVHSQASKKNPVLSQTQTIRASDPSLKLSSELVESVQSLTTLLQRQVESSSSQPSTGVLPHAKSEHQVMKEDNDDRSNTPQERTSLEGFRLQLAQKERELCLREEQLQKKHKQEMDTLSQENYVLKSKLHSAEETSKKAKFDFGNVSDPVTEEKLRLLEKDMKEQEALIQGYQKENEKLCLQMKAMQAKGKETEEALFMENQRLLSELSLSRGRMNMDSIQRAPGGKSFSEPNSRDEELTGQIQAAQRNQMRLEDEIRRLKQEKQVMYVDLEKMMKERDLAKTQALNTSGDKSLELRLLQEKHQEEVTELKKRLQWYAENQELLNKDAARLRAATVETQKLSEQVERMKVEVSRRASEHLIKTKERAGDAKRILDLEEKLKQMEELLKQRHPNSLPALILAAASAEENVGPPVASETTALLEKRVHRLEAELEGRDEEAKSSLRMMEQQFHKIKLQYEEQIANLEQRLAEKSRIDQVLSSPLPDSQAQRLMAELEELKKVDGEKESALQIQIASLKEQLQQAQSVIQLEKPARSPSRHQLQAEAAQATRIERLTQELNTKTRTVQELTRTVERLQKERRSMLSGPVVNQEPKLHLAASKAAKQPAVKSFPSTRDEKDYHPGDFSGLDISEVQVENASLRERLEQMEIQREKERVSLQASITYAQNQVLRVQEQNAEQLSSVKAEHRKEVERILACHAMEHSSSKVAELTNSLNTQEIIMQHLQRQVKELQGSRDALVVSKAREEALQNQLAKLLGELKQAKAAQSPELKHFISLEQKIQFMELRYDQREQQLHQVITDARKVMEQESRGEVERWKRVAQGRAKELETFRLELDSILDVLRELQRQGVVIPVPERTSTSAHTYLPLPP